MTSKVYKGELVDVIKKGSKNSRIRILSSGQELLVPNSSLEVASLDESVESEILQQTTESSDKVDLSLLPPFTSVVEDLAPSEEVAAESTSPEFIEVENSPEQMKIEEISTEEVAETQFEDQDYSLNPPEQEFQEPIPLLSNIPEISLPAINPDEPVNLDTTVYPRPQKVQTLHRRLAHLGQIREMPEYGDFYPKNRPGRGLPG